MIEEENYHAIVNSIELQGPHGPYAIANEPSIGSISFSLTPRVWKETEHPELGIYVVLSKLTKKRAGWRANHARFLKPRDEKKEK